jgi:hypothetical protein
MDIHLVAYYIGIFIVFFSHIYILFSKSSYKMMMYHAYLNIFGALLIAYYFMYKEGFIDF